MVENPGCVVAQVLGSGSSPHRLVKIHISRINDPSLYGDGGGGVEGFNVRANTKKRDNDECSISLQIRSKVFQCTGMNIAIQLFSTSSAFQ